MLRTGLLIFLLVLLPFLSFADETEKQLISFLQSRKVIAQISFDAGSDQLSRQSRKKLDLLVPELTEVSTQSYLLRVEGFASQDGSASKNVNLSMKRAMKVLNYFQDEHGLNLDLFLTGFGGDISAQNNKDARRVDIAIYQKAKAAMALFDDHGTVEKIVVK